MARIDIHSPAELPAGLQRLLPARLRPGTTDDGRPPGWLPGTWFHCARFNDMAAGVALWAPLPRDRERLLFLTTAPAFRRRGVARALLDAGLETAQTQGRKSVESWWSDRLPGRQSFEAALSSHGWSAAETGQLRCEIRCGDILDWVAAHGYQRRYRYQGRERLLPLRDLDRNGMAMLRALTEAPDFERHLDPRPWLTEADPATSLALYRDDRMVGWILACMRPDGKLHYMSAYVRPELQRGGTLLGVYYESVRRLAETRGRDCIYRVETTPETPFMMAFIRRRLAPLTQWWDAYLVSRRNLSAP